MKFELCVLLIASLLIGGNAQLECYQCTNCGDPFDSEADNVQVIQCQVPLEPDPTTPLPEITTTPEETTVPEVTTEVTSTTSPDGTPEQTTDVPTMPTPSLTPPPGTEEPTTSDPSQTTTTSTGPVTTTQTSLTPPPTFMNSRFGYRLNGTRDTASLRCYIATINGQTNRGCVTELDTKENTCNSIPGGVIGTECSLCATNLCNSAAGLMASTFTLLICLILTMR